MFRLRRDFAAPARRLLKALEARAKERGNTSCHLLSTETACRFYRDRGYVGAGAPQNKFGTNSSYPMTKEI